MNATAVLANAYAAYGIPILVTTRGGSVREGALCEDAYVVCADSVLALMVPALMLLWRFGPDKVRQSLNRFAVFVPLPPHPDALCPGEWRFGLARVAIARVGHLSSRDARVLVWFLA